MDLLTLLIANYGGHEKLSKKAGVSRQKISYNNLVEDIQKRNIIGAELAVLINEPCYYSVAENNRVLTFEIKEL